MINTDKGLLDILDKFHYDAIVVEGYDGVGKGRILELLSDHYGVVPYRPDYNLWQKFDHRIADRWKVSGFFWDVFSHFDLNIIRPLLFDRGVLSGAVYNNNMEIAKEYPKMIRDMSILHILVKCDEEDYIQFSLQRNPYYTLSAIKCEYDKYIEYTSRYENAISISGVDYLVYKNIYDTSIQSDRSLKCKGCGHYNHGWCRHPEINKEVSAECERCGLSRDKEVQDYDE